MNLSDLALYLITDRAQTGGRDLAAVVDAACRGGVRAVQLRERDLDTRALLRLARQLRAVTRAHAARLLVNDRIDVALACDADGVQLPASSFHVADARLLLGDGRLIGVSTHSPDEARDAAALGADFVVCGPVFDTPSKRAFGAPLGLDALRAAVTACAAPLVAVGGITAETAAQVRETGAAGIAVIRALLLAPDPESTARALLRS
jgi:thiamine-phosphate pyrophosphorylase